jgi:hypothetical protein
MSAIVPPKSSIGPPVIKTLLLPNCSKSLKLTVYETTDTYTLFIGGHNLFCIEGLIYKTDSVYVTRLNFPANVVRLSHIYYNINCSLEGNFQRGIDTNRILQTMCEYIRDHYKYVDTVSLNDASFRTCDDGHDVDLATMTYLRTGKTWYEKNYNAYLDERDVPKYNAMEQRMRQLKTTMRWNDFKQFIKGEYPLSESEMQTMFENTSTWQDFFGPLSDKIGISEFCIFVSPWLHAFFWNMTQYSFASGTYYIPLKNIPIIKYTPVEYKRGGKRFTAKRIRAHKKRNYQ